MAYRRQSPGPVVEGMTGVSTLTTYELLAAGTTATGPIQQIPAGTSGQILVSGGAGVLPAFANASPTSISVTGDTGGALTGTSFTFTGGGIITGPGAGGTGLNFGGSGTTETLTFAGINANGGPVYLATDNTTSTVEIGTGIGNKTVTLGSNSSSSTTTLQSGTGSLEISSQGTSIGALNINSEGSGGVLTITSTDGPLNIDSGIGQMTISAAAANTIIDIGTGAAAKQVTIGSATGASSLTLKSGSGGITVVPSGTASSGVLVTNNVGLVSEANSATVGLPLVTTSSTTAPSFSALTVAGGGTGDTTFSAYAPILAGTTATGAFQQATTNFGTSGNVLTSTGSSSVPTWQTPATSSISITGNSGGALTGNAFTFTGGFTGLTFAGAGTTETLQGTLIVGNGGTGLTSLTAHNVLLGEGTSNVGFAAPTATAGVPLVSTGSSSDPDFGTATVPGGGTGATSFTAYSVITAGSSSTGALQNVSGVGTSGQVLTSQGAGTLPVWANSSTTLTVTSVNFAGTPYTVVSTDQFIQVDTSLGVVTIYLPGAPATGRTIIIKDEQGTAATHNITLTTSAGFIGIDGSTSYIMNTNYQSVSVIFNGINYLIY